jgi:hypothetical protein
VEDQSPAPHLYSNRFAADAAGASRSRTTETCFRTPDAAVRFHGERQDPSSPGWLHLLELIDDAAADGRELFRPLVDLTPSERMDLVTLPSAIGKLTQVKHLVLYGSQLVRLPPEIGSMTSLEVFEPYTSYSLHWFPYELTRCATLRSSTVSTRALYGNVKNRPAFPELSPDGHVANAPDLGELDPQIWGVDRLGACSVCAGPISPALFRQRWISLRVATDVLPLLVNACSDRCVQSLPAPPDDYVPGPHRGGRDLRQPKASW